MRVILFGEDISVRISVRENVIRHRETRVCILVRGLLEWVNGCGIVSLEYVNVHIYIEQNRGDEARPRRQRINEGPVYNIIHLFLLNIYTYMYTYTFIQFALTL